MNTLNTTPDTTPSADAREPYTPKNPGSDYGDKEWRQKGSIGVSRVVSVETEETEDMPDQLSLFDATRIDSEDSAESHITDKPQPTDRYGHVEGASARELRRADEIAIRQQYRS